MLRTVIIATLQSAVNYSVFLHNAIYNVKYNALQYNAGKQKVVSAGPSLIWKYELAALVVQAVISVATPS